jgi:hypothetical protein
MIQDIQNDIEQKLFEKATDLIFNNRRIDSLLRVADKENIPRFRAREIWQLAKQGLAEVWQ